MGLKDDLEQRLTDGLQNNTHFSTPCLASIFSTRITLISLVILKVHENQIMTHPKLVQRKLLISSRSKKTV